MGEERGRGEAKEGVDPVKEDNRDERERGKDEGQEIRRVDKLRNCRERKK